MFQKKEHPWPLFVHVALLILFAMFMITLWMLPVVFTGLPLEPPELSLGKRFLETGLLPLSASRLTPLFVAFFSSSIPWLDFPTWSAVAAGAFAAALAPWWASVHLLFGRRIAWVSTVLLAMMPLYWLQAMVLTYYSFAFFFLFLAFLLFIVLHRSSPVLACILSGVSFGVCIGLKDTFIIFLPWLVGAYAWIYRDIRRDMLLRVAAFCLAVGVVFTVPVLPQVLAQDAPFTEKLLSLLPVDRGTPSWDHFYPDQYTYEFDREWFDAQAAERDRESGLLERLQGEHRLVSFGVVRSAWRSLRNGVWFTIGSIPDFFLQDYVGGAVLWLFIVPGAVALYRRDKRLLLLMIGLSASSLLIVRFVLHFERTHLMNDGWVLALLAAIGIDAVADALSKQWKGMGIRTVVAGVTVVLAVQMLQANRAQLARMYAKTRIPEHMAATAEIALTPEDAVIAVPEGMGFAPLVNRRTQVFRPETVERLAGQRNLAKAFAHYGVTHAMGYDAPIESLIRRSSARTKVLTIPEDAARNAIEVSPLMEYLLHVFR